MSFVWSRARINEMSAEEIETRAAILEARVAELLKGNNPVVVGAALGPIIAAWLAGHCDAEREKTWQNFRKLVEDIYPALAKELWGAYRRLS